MRLFTGIELSSSITDIAENFRKENKHLEGLKWTKTESLHITTYFIGEVPQNELNTIIEKIASTCNTIMPFKLNAKRIDFSPGKKPYMLWMYFEESEYFSEVCEKIALSIKGKELKRFHPLPHITLARLKKPHIYFNLNQNDYIFPEIEVNKITLWQSTLEPKSAKYHKLHEFELKNE